MSESKCLSQRAFGVPWSGVRRMFNLAHGHKDVINLSVGEPDFSTPSHVVQSAIEAMRKGFTHYTPNAGLSEFREAAAEKLRRENKIEADSENEIIATVGAMGGLSTAMLTIVNPGDEVLIPDPGFASYGAQAILAEGKPVSYYLDCAADFALNPETISRSITPKTKAIVINSPSNPTGSVLEEHCLRKIAEIALENDLIVISDEAYEAITYDGFKHISIASLDDMKDRTISVFSLSKTYAMTGWRIGFVVAKKEIITHMVKLQEHLAAHPSSISQMAGVAALNGPKDITRLMVNEYSERRDLIVDGLRSIRGVECSRPRGAFYVFPRIESFGVSSDTFAMLMLQKAGVIVVGGTAFGGNGEGYIRISYAASREKVTQALDKMKNALKDQIGQ